MQAMRKLMAEQGARSDRTERGRDARPDWESIRKRIEGAVEAGKMTREEADKAYKGIKERMAGARAQRDGDARPDWEGIKRRIEGAVKSGNMTREQADAKYKEIRETLAKERGGER